MQLDVRIPIGLLFVVFGAILAGFGWLSDPALSQAHALGHNLNLGWGVAQLVFGGLMLGLAWRGHRRGSE